MTSCVAVGNADNGKIKNGDKEREAPNKIIPSSNANPTTNGCTSITYFSSSWFLLSKAKQKPDEEKRALPMESIIT